MHILVLTLPHTRSMLFLTSSEAVAPLQNSIWTVLRRAFRVSAGKSLQGSLPPSLSTSMKISLSFCCSLSALSLTQAKRHRNWQAERPGKPPNPSIQTQAKCVKLDPKFEKHYREVHFQKYRLIISTLFTFGSGQDFVVHITCTCTHWFPQILRKAAQFD